MTTRRFVDRERSPHNGGFRNGHFSGEDSRRAPFHYDVPKFDRDNKKPAILNQLSQEGSTYKQSSRSSYRPRSDRFPDSRNNSDYKSRQFGDGSRSNRRSNDFPRDRDNRRSGDWREPQVKRYGEESAFKIKETFDAPRTGYYFEHDNRGDGSHNRSPPRRRRSIDRSNGSARHEDTFGYKRSDRFDSKPYDNSGRYYPENRNDTKRRYSDYREAREPPGRSDGIWRHDKFEQEVDSNDDDQRGRRRRSRS